MTAAPALTAGDGMFGLFGQRDLDIAAIHHATGFYTVVPEIEALLDRLGWPAEGTRLLDPGAGNGGFLVAALRRLDLAAGDVAAAAFRVRGFEFYPGAVAEARAAVRAHLTGRGWSPAAAHRAAVLIVEDRDFLLLPLPAGDYDVIAANPPYWRLANLPPGYRADYELMVPAHARADLLHAYLQRSADIIAPGGRIGLITADRWLLNASAAELRRRLGARYRVADIRRLDAASAFYAAKQRRRGTPARVHPVSLILTPTGPGRRLDAGPFRLTAVPDVDGVPLPRLAGIRLAPWLGPDGVFTVTDTTGLPAGHLVPVVEPEDIAPETLRRRLTPRIPEALIPPEPGDITGGTIRPPRKWAIVTGPGEPPPAVLAHLDAQLHRMSPRGRRTPRWLPPETFSGQPARRGKPAAPPLPLPYDAVLVPRIAKHLRAIRLPAGRLPVNHQLVVVSGLPPETILRMLHDPAVQAQAEALALSVDGGYRSYTATLLRHLTIPRRLIPPACAQKGHQP